MKLAAMLGFLLLFGCSLLALQVQQKEENADIVLVIEEMKQQDSGREIQLLDGETVLSIPLEEYLVGVVLTEMPVSFHPEAMKAQAVAARTFAARHIDDEKHENADICSDSTCCQAWRSEAELRQVFGENFEEYIEKGKSSVSETEGEVLLYDNNLIDAVYFSCSGGTSEDAVAVWGTDVPYLQSVKSPGEEKSSKFSSEVHISFEEFCQRLKRADASVRFSVIPQDWLGEVCYTDGGGVDRILLGGVWFSGTEVRKIFQLPSTRFTLDVGDGEIVFSVLGYGHRVGMSQYGADAMAENGAAYKDILLHYYTGVTIKKLSRTDVGTVN